LYTAYRNTVRAVRTDEWKLIRYPQRNYTQLFNLKNDPLEINNLAALPENKTKVNEMMALLDEWHTLTSDTATMNPKIIIPMEYDYTKLKQKPDVHQPEYILKKYFKGVDLTKTVKADH
jgi:arylsulfatase A-like enzyme